MSTRLKQGELVPFEYRDRQFVLQRGHNIRDIYDALAEMITNSDDSYGRLYRAGQRTKDGGDILIEYGDSRGGLFRCVVVRDSAEGMNRRDMEQKLVPIGEYTSQSGSRGHIGRGLRDCTALGDVVVESIKDGRYYRCRMPSATPGIKLEVNGTEATGLQRKQLGVHKGNGTSVTVEVDRRFHLHEFATVADKLRWHYALRDIMSQGADSRVLIRRIGATGKPKAIVYRPPEGNLALDEMFEVEGYRGGTATLRVWRATEPLEEGPRRFERFGILIKGKRAIHECSLLVGDLGKNEDARRFYGRLECPYLDDLMDQFEATRKHPSRENPTLVIDPTRRTGLVRDHPFAQRLLSAASDYLRQLVAREKERDKSGQQEMASRETRARLNSLARFAGRFLREQLDELDGVSAGDWVDPGGMAKRGMTLVPVGASIPLGEEKRFYFYVRGDLLKEGQRTFKVVPSSDAVEVLGAPFRLATRDGDSHGDRFSGVFRVRGKKISLAEELEVCCEGLEPVKASVDVTQATAQDREFVVPIEFEKSEYRVREGGTRALCLFARSPDPVDQEVEVKLRSEDTDKVAVRGRCLLVPVAGTNYAQGTVTVEGRTLNSRAAITASLDGVSASAEVRVVEKPGEPGVPLKIELKPASFEPFRSRWSPQPGETHVLEISGLHPSLSRYLGEPAGSPPQWPGQNSPLYLVLLAEVVGEAVCHRLMLEEAGKQSYELEELRNAGEIRDVLETVRYQYHKRLSKFLLRAHAEMVSDTEAKWA